MTGHHGPAQARASDQGMGGADLDRLAAELHGQSYEARLVTHPGRRPFVNVRNRQASALTENIYSDGQHFYWGWAEPIASTADIAGAAEAIDRVLRAVHTRR